MALAFSVETLYTLSMSNTPPTFRRCTSTITIHVEVQFDLASRGCDNPQLPPCQELVPRHLTQHPSNLSMLHLNHHHPCRGTIRPHFPEVVTTPQLLPCHLYTLSILQPFDVAPQPSSSMLRYNLTSLPEVVTTLNYHHARN